MKIHIPCLVLLLMMCRFGADAQQYYDNQVTLHDVTCVQKGSQIRLGMTVDASKADVPRRKAWVLTPVVKSDSTDSELPPVVISGRNRYKADNRIKHFNGDTAMAYATPYVTVKSGSDEASSIVYDYTGPFEPWMKKARIEMKEAIYGCAACKDSETQHPLTDIVLDNIEPKKPEVKPLLSYISPKAEAVKNRDMTGQAYLDFPVGKAVILTDFRDNFKELTKIREAIDEVKNNPNAVIDGIVLKGYASPEGKYASNERLSEERSQALKDYLQKEYKYSNRMFNVSSVAEDWPGLKTLTEASDLADKQAVLAIIDNKSVYDVKERELKALKGGATYKTLLADYFPRLRRVDYKLNFTIRAFSVDEGKEIVKTHPGQMSLNEMFLVANTYPKGSDDFNQVFDVAVRMYPTDTVANINASAIELERGDVTAAHRFLDPYQQTPESWNNQGVLYMLDGDFAKAEDFLNKAKERGATEADENLKILVLLKEYKVKKDKYEAAKKQ